MSLVAYTITAIERDVADATISGKQVIAGATCSMYIQPADTVVTLYDDAAGTGGASSKVTGANGQVTVYVEPGQYRLSVNGVDSYVTISDDLPDSWDYDAAGNLTITSSTADPSISIAKTGSGKGFYVSRGNGSSYAIDASGGGALSGSTMYAISRTRAGSISGTPTSGVASINEVSIGADSVNAKDAIANEFMSQFIGHTFTGGNGGRSGVRISVDQTGATTNKADVGGSGPFMKALSATMASSSNDGGTSGSEYGNVHGALLRAELETGATYYNAVVGLEINPNIETGADALRRTGFKIVPEANGVNQGSTLDNAFSIVNQSGAAKWDYGFTFGDPTGVWPITSTGTMIHAFDSGADAKTAATAIDFSNVTFSGDIVKFSDFAIGNDGVTRPAGIVFGESTTPNANNTLDVYEAGTYTPTVSFGGGSTGVTYTSQEGEYTKIGDLVFFRAFVQLSSKGTDVGDVAISLPSGVFPSSTTGVSVGSAFNMTATIGALYATVQPAGTISIKKETGTGNATITNTDVANSMYIIISGTFKV